MKRSRLSLLITFITKLLFASSLLQASKTTSGKKQLEGGHKTGFFMLFKGLINNLLQKFKNTQKYNNQDSIENDEEITELEED